MAVEEHPRLKVLKAITALLDEITVEAGFVHDLEGKNFRGRASFGDDTVAPYTSLLESPKPDFGNYAGDNEARSETWTLLIQGWAQDDKANPSDPVYALVGDVELKLAEAMALDGRSGKPRFPEKYMLPDDDGNPQITSLQLSPPVVRPMSSEPTAKVCFYLQLRVGLAQSVG